MDSHASPVAGDRGDLGTAPATLAQMQACTRELDAVVAPLAAQKTPVVLAPLHCVSDILAAMVGAGVTPGKASVVVSSSAESYTVASRKWAASRSLLLNPPG